MDRSNSESRGVNSTMGGGQIMRKTILLILIGTGRGDRVHRFIFLTIRAMHRNYRLYNYE